MKVSPYLNFGGRCEEALDFYAQALGAVVIDKMRFDQAPDAPPPGMLAPGFESKIMHSSFRVGDDVIMATDGGCQTSGKIENCSLAAQVTSVEEAERVFAALSDGGQVQMPLGATFFSERFGMLVDRFGVPWMVIVIPG